LKTSSEKNTPVQALATLHESASLRAVTGLSLRPGGFRLTERGLTLCGFGPGVRIIDVGCGTGASVTYLREKHQIRAFGIDLSGDLFRKDGSKRTVPVAVARAEELPFADGSCDGVLCECVLSLVLDPKQAVEEFSRVLRSGGFLILSDLYERLPDDEFSSGRTTSGGSASGLSSRVFVEKLLEDSGFGLLAWEDHTRSLKELAAQLILSSESREGFDDQFGVFGSGCASSCGSRLTRPGYYLLVAQKLTNREAFHGRYDVSHDGAEAQGVLLQPDHDDTGH